MRPRRSLLVLSAAALVATAASAVPAAVATTDPATTTITLFLKAPHPAALARLAASHGLSRTARLAALRPLLPSDATHNAIAQSLRLQGFRVVDQTVWSITATRCCRHVRRPVRTARRAVRGEPRSRAPAPQRARCRASPQACRSWCRRRSRPTVRLPIYHHSTGVLDGSAFRNAYAPAHTTPSTGQNDGPATVATIQLANFYGPVPGQFSNSQQATDLSQYASEPRPGRPGREPPLLRGEGRRRADATTTTTTGGDPRRHRGRARPRVDPVDRAVRAPAGLLRAERLDGALQRGVRGVLDDVAGQGTPRTRTRTSSRCRRRGGSARAETGATAIRTLEPILQSLTAAGVTVFASSGDAGIYDCGDARSTQPDVDYPGSSPSVISVGGTHLSAPKNAANTGTNWTETRPGRAATPSDCLAGNGGTGGGRSGRPTRRATTPSRVSPRRSGNAPRSPRRRSATTRSGSSPTSPPTARPRPGSSSTPATGSTASAPTATPTIGGTSLSSPMSAALLTNALAGAGHTTGAGDIHGALYSAYHASRSLRNTNPAKAVRDVTAGQNGSPNDRHSDPSVFATSRLRHGQRRRRGAVAGGDPVHLRQARAGSAGSARERPASVRWAVAHGRRLAGVPRRVPTRVCSARPTSTIRRLGAGQRPVSNYLYPPSGTARLHRRARLDVPAHRRRARHRSAPVGADDRLGAGAARRPPLHARFALAPCGTLGRHRRLAPERVRARGARTRRVRTDVLGARPRRAGRGRARRQLPRAPGGQC